jgi:acyl carrier protein
VSDPLISLFAEVLEVDPAGLDDDSSPDNLSAWDSLAAMKLVSAIEDRFDVRLSTRQIMTMASIGLARKTLRTMNVQV